MYTILSTMGKRPGVLSYIATSQTGLSAKLYHLHFSPLVDSVSCSYRLISPVFLDVNKESYPFNARSVILFEGTDDQL